MCNMMVAAALYLFSFIVWQQIEKWLYLYVFALFKQAYYHHCVPAAFALVVPACCLLRARTIFISSGHWLLTILVH
jgi:hypothetical protein